VPFLDLGPQHEHLAQGLLAELAELIDQGAFTNGPQVAAFEEAFAKFCGSSSCVGLASGLDALRLALLGAELEPGDEVIVPAMTFVATIEAVTQAGGQPVMVDIGESDCCLDVDAASAAIGSRTRFLLPVHLYGQMADMHAIDHLAASRDLRILEDACQAHGAVRDGLSAGVNGVAGAFSFYPGKNLGAFGDAGALVTNDDHIAARVRALREHGQSEKYRHALEGYTARLDTIQALVLLQKLPFLERWNRQRSEAARLYSAALAGVGDLRLPPVPEGSEPVWHLYVVRTGRPTRLQAHLAARGIGCGRHYPYPCHLTEAYAWLGYRPGAFPVAESLAAEALSLPLYPGISEGQIERVVEAVEDYFRGG
jgi:dTDP-4-amino-4,6-dideoxygalactose transaminase